jgi:hypothetical protein
MANGQTIGKLALAAATHGWITRYEKLMRNRYKRRSGGQDLPQAPHQAVDTFGGSLRLQGAVAILCLPR